jgi:plasmid stabilization system protein ParE
MNFRLLWSSDALDDLDSIWKDVLKASGDYETADSYIAGLRNEISRKREYPHSGTPLKFLGMSAGIRYVHYKRYLVFYRVRKDAIEIGRVLFDGSDYMKKLFGFIGEA